MVKLIQPNWEIVNPAVVSSGNRWRESFFCVCIFMYTKNVYLFYDCRKAQANGELQTSHFKGGGTVLFTGRNWTVEAWTGPTFSSVCLKGCSAVGSGTDISPVLTFVFWIFHSLKHNRLSAERWKKTVGLTSRGLNCTSGVFCSAWNPSDDRSLLALIHPVFLLSFLTDLYRDTTLTQPLTHLSTRLVWPVPCKCFSPVKSFFKKKKNVWKLKFEFQRVNTVYIYSVGNMFYMVC